MTDKPPVDQKAKKAAQAAWEAGPEFQAARAAGLCGSRTRAGKACQNPGHGIGGRCRKHGGAQGSGRPIEHGRRSRVLNEALGNLLDAVHGRAQDDQLLDLREGVAFFDEVRDQLLERAVEDRDTPRFRASCYQQAKAVQDLMRAKDPRFVEAFGELVRDLGRGVARDRALMEALSVTERRAMRAEAARTVAAKEAATVPARAFEVFTEHLCRLVAQRVGPAEAVGIIRGIEQMYAKQRPTGARQLQVLPAQSA